MGYVLIIYACLISDPAKCDQFRSVAMAQGYCMAIPTILGDVAKWTELHPTRRVDRWKCVPLSKVEEDV